jgi:hypothetical protein
MPATSAKEAFKIFQSNTATSALSPVHFLKVKLYNQSGRLIYENTYWIGNTYLDYKALNNLPSIGHRLYIKPVKATVLRNTGTKDLSYIVTNNSLKLPHLELEPNYLTMRGNKYYPPSLMVLTLL